MKNSILQAVLAVGILKFTDINEGFLCKIEARKIRNEVENAIANFKKGIITGQQLWQNCSFLNKADA